MTRGARVLARLAIEALRAGVPNGEAIARLGGSDTEIVARFQAGLETFHDAPNAGVVVAGDFGSGKSHLLGYLRHRALQMNCIVSTVVVSKETPLSIPGVTYAAAMRNAAALGVNDDAITLALTRVQGREGAVQRLELWCSDPRNGMTAVFGAILYLLNRSIDPALRQAIEAFLAGSKPPLIELRKALREAGVRSLFELASVPAAELVRQRMRFMPHLFRAAGYAGWVVLIDEVELIGRYGPMQRALAYAELAQWLGLDEALRVPGLYAACAITDDFAGAVINAKQDDERLTERLRQRNLPRQAELAHLAIRAIEGAMPLRAPDDAVLRRHEAAIRDCYREAYGWDAPPATIAERLKNRTMRHHIRGWVTQWDMLRISGSRTTLIEETFQPDYQQDDQLTEAPDGFDARE